MNKSSKWVFTLVQSLATINLFMSDSDFESAYQSRT